jgi:hypothetical protein
VSLSELQRRNLIVKFRLENPNKSISETVEYLKLLGYKKFPIYCTIKKFEKQENVGEKMKLFCYSEPNSLPTSSALYCPHNKLFWSTHN